MAHQTDDAEVDDAPTNERGAAPSPEGLLTGDVLQHLAREQAEDTPDLRWPYNVPIYDRMRTQDGQVMSGLRAYNYPILRTGLHLDTEGVDKTVATFVARNLGLTDTGDGEVRESSEGIRIRDVVRRMLLMLPFGHAVGETIYAMDSPPADLASLPGRVAKLHRVGERLPRSISRWEVSRGGDLEAIWQWIPVGPRRTGRSRVQSMMSGLSPGGWDRWDERRIPASQLVVAPFEMEGGDWTGRSLLRQAYKHWLIKDALLRLGPVALERSMGLLVGHYDPEDTQGANRLDKVLKSLRTGEDQRATLPKGTDVEMMGVTGQIRDELPLVKYHDEAIGRSMLAMLLNLGHDRGARSLGETFLDVFLYALQSIAEQIEDVVTDGIIRPLVTYNFGGDETHPRLRFDDMSARPELTAEALGVLVKWGIVTPDGALEDFTREKWGLPPDDGTGAPPEVPPDDEPPDDGLPNDQLPDAIDDLPVEGQQGRRPVRRPHQPGDTDAVADALEQRLAQSLQQLRQRRRKQT